MCSQLLLENIGSVEFAFFQSNDLENRNLEAKTRNKVSLIPAHLTTLDEYQRQWGVCQDSPKGIMPDSSVYCEIVISFAPYRDSQDSLQQPQLGEVFHIIHQNKIFTTLNYHTTFSTGTWVDIWFKDIMTISQTSPCSSIEIMQIFVSTKWASFLNRSSTISAYVYFISVGLFVSSASLSPDQ